MPTEVPGPIRQIHEAMTAILDELPAIGKDSTNEALRFSFRGIDAIVNALNPLLGKHGVVPTLAESTLLHWEAKQKGYAAVVLNTYRFVARDGTYLEAQAVGEGHDFGDKAVSKANTMAFKTCLGQTFCLAYEDDPDGDTVVAEEPKVSPEPARKKAARAAKQPPGGSASPPAADEELQKEKLQKLRDELWSTVDGLSDKERADLKGWMVGLEITTDFDALTKEQVEAVRKYVDDNFAEPFLNGHD